MKRKTVKYTDEPLKAKVIADFLPPPSELIFREDQVKVTLALSKKSIAFFKKQSEKSSVGYQTMIRNLLDKYTEHFAG